MMVPSWLHPYRLFFDFSLSDLDVGVGRRLYPSRGSGGGNFGVGISFDEIEGELDALVFDSLLEALDGPLHLLGGLDVGQGFEVDKRPYLGLDKLSLKLFEHCVKLLIAEDEPIVLGDSAVGRFALIRKQVELLHKLEAIAFSFDYHSREQAK